MNFDPSMHTSLGYLMIESTGRSFAEVDPGAALVSFLSLSITWCNKEKDPDTGEILHVHNGKWSKLFFSLLYLVKKIVGMSKFDMIRR